MDYLLTMYSAGQTESAIGGSKIGSKISPLSFSEFVMSLLKALVKNCSVGHRERCKTFFNNEILSDVKFIVQASQQCGERDSKRSKMEIPAHKFLLSISSPVFFAMFCGEIAETKEHIDLPDCEYEGMLELLRYIYTDEVCLNGNNVMQVLYLAEKYMLPCLTCKCTEYLGKNLDLSNVFCVLNHAEQYRREDLLYHCWDKIDQYTAEALKSNEFLSMDRSFLSQLVKRKTLNIREVDLFKAIDCWAKEECKRKQLRTNGSVKRRVLGEKIVKNIRFPIMRQEEFKDTVLPSKILTQKETRKLMEYFTSVLTSPVGFLEEHRMSSLLRFCRFKSFATQGNILGNDPDKSDWIPLRVDKNIMLHGVSLLGNDGGQFTVNIQVEMSSDDEETVVAVKKGTFTSGRKECNSGFYYGFDVFFDNPVLVKKDCGFFIEAEVDGPGYFYGMEGVNGGEFSGVTFRFGCRRVVFLEDPVPECIDPSVCAEFLFKLAE